MQSGDEYIRHEEQYKLYRSRWYMLAVLAVLNFSNGMIWMSFGNIVDPASRYFNASTLQIDFLSIAFMIATLVLGLPAMWLLDRHGIKISFQMAAWTNAIGAVLRILGTLPDLKGDRYALLLIGQIVAGCAQPFMIFAPTKLVAQWFGSGERTLANAVGSLANPLGFCSGGLLSTLLVSATKHDDFDILHKQMQIMLGVTASPALFGLLMMMFVSKSQPPTEPSPSAAHEIEPFFWGLKVLSGMKYYIMLSICYGAGVGILSSLVTIIDQLLLPRGYSNVFSATCICLFVVCGFVGAAVASLVVDRFKNHEVVAKVAFCLGAAFLILFVVLSHFPNLHLPIVVVLIVGGSFCLSISPLCMELAVESSYPVAVGTSGGVMVISGQLMSALLTFLLSVGSQPTATEGHEIINPYSLIAFLVLILPAPLTFLLFFSSPDLRIRFEQTTPDTILNLPQFERELLVSTLLKSHARCICNRLENTQSSLVVTVGSGDDDGSCHEEVNGW